MSISLEERTKKLKIDIRSTLICGAGSRGQTADLVNRNYRDETCRDIPFRDLGFPSLYALLANFTDVCTVIGDLVYPVVTEETEHTLKLVQTTRRQRPTLRPRRSAGFFASQFSGVRDRGVGSPFALSLAHQPGIPTMPFTFRRPATGTNPGAAPFVPTVCAEPAPTFREDLRGNLPQRPLEGWAARPQRSPDSGFEEKAKKNLSTLSEETPMADRKQALSLRPMRSSPLTLSDSSRRSLQFHVNCVERHNRSFNAAVPEEPVGPGTDTAEEVTETIEEPGWSRGRVEAEDDWDAEFERKDARFGIREGRQSLWVGLAQYEDLGNLYFVRKGAFQDLGRMEADMRETYAEARPKSASAALFWDSAPVEEIVVGLHCAVDLGPLGFNRAAVLSVDVDAADAQVHCFDYGTTSNAPMAKIHLLPERLAELPRLAKRVRMSGCELVRVTSETALENLVMTFCAVDELDDIRLTLDVVGVDEDGTTVVNIFREETSSGKWVELATELLQNNIVCLKSIDEVTENMGTLEVSSSS